MNKCVSVCMCLCACTVVFGPNTHYHWGGVAAKRSRAPGYRRDLQKQRVKVICLTGAGRSFVLVVLDWFHGNQK